MVIHFNAGEKINYKGENAVVVSDNFGSSSITICVDGKQISVDRNDLFGMNKDNSYFQKRIAQCDARIAKFQKTIDFFNKLWSAAKEAAKDCRRQMASILSAFKATNYKQIDDKEQRDAYLALMGQNYDAKRTMNRASSSVISAAIDAGSECFAKGNLLNQQALYEHLA